ncbi:MAG: hypothetical protein FJX20_09690 [Alphaproteobacteria bacterium]|nr:hypothetical protein [Alphaproteobacteria bacterium]
MPTSPASDPRPNGTLRKAVIIVAIIVCLILATLGGFLPIIPGWLFLVPALYLLATEFESGRRWITSGRRRWPWLSRQVKAACESRWAPRFARTLDELTDPTR